MACWCRFPEPPAPGGNCKVPSFVDENKRLNKGVVRGLHVHPAPGTTTPPQLTALSCQVFGNKWPDINELRHKRGYAGVCYPRSMRSVPLTLGPCPVLSACAGTWQALGQTSTTLSHRRCKCCPPLTWARRTDSAEATHGAARVQGPKLRLGQLVPARRRLAQVLGRRWRRHKGCGGLVGRCEL